MFNSVKFKITITAFFIISVIMVLSTLRDINQTEQKLLNAQKEKAVLLSERITHGIMVLMLKNRWQDLQTFMESLIKDSKELKGIRIFLPENGTIVASSEPKEIGREIYKKDVEIFKNGEYQKAFLVEKEGQWYTSKLTVIQNQPICHRCHGSDKEVLGVLGIDISLNSVYQTSGAFKKEHFMDALIGFLLMGSGIMLVVGILIERPVRKMIRTIRKIENGDLSARMEENKKDEFGLMAKSFNSMVESLESANKEIEQFHMEQIQRAARLASLGEIISGIAHEIKNPLTGISCAVQLIQSEMKADDDKKEITAEILLQIKRLDRIVKDLLNYAKPKPPQFLPNRIEGILEKALFFVYPEAKGHDISIDPRIDNDLPEVMMDPDQMQQVFLNLMINAIQAMPSGGRLAISISIADSQTVGEKIKGQILSNKIMLIRFQDTGEGIEQEHLENIFDPFYTRKTKGTGLGLSISQRIVHEHGGEITVESTPGKGTVFTISLPLIETGGRVQE
ncbi:MAG: HAMP domain-containing protein [Nitrospirae bacterium]|nr:HAMP domain-containing protein [Nitrospirota bacterium]